MSMKACKILCWHTPIACRRRLMISWEVVSPMGFEDEIKMVGETYSAYRYYYYYGSLSVWRDEAGVGCLRVTII